ncbi:MAG: tRNA preQ1(34) S-adenosylmethionine ribosyltransferase-isomerase QueA [Patescibacteria group bacterium]
MKLSDFDYELPSELIAQSPAEPRDHSRLLVLDKESGEIQSDIFKNITKFFKPGDLLVLNNTKVIPARLLGKNYLTHGSVEIFLHKQINNFEWEILGKRLKSGKRVVFESSKLEAIVQEKKNDMYIVRFNLGGDRFISEIEKIGLIPIPPYIRKGKSEAPDRDNYQTIFAKRKGSVAAPTAGLHFTKELLEQIKGQGVDVEFVLLHVGLGTFAPVKVDDIKDHKMHSEYFEISKKLISKILQTKNNGGRIIAVGTTTARVLETAFGQIEINSEKHEVKGQSEAISGWTDIFIYPGYKFKSIDALVTNFHLPKSTLLMLVSAFAGEKNIKKSYEFAINSKYRFYSYGDAMLII